MFRHVLSPANAAGRSGKTSRSSAIFRERTSLSGRHSTSIARSRTARGLSEQARQEADDAVQIAKFREAARRTVYRRRPRSGRRSGAEIGDLSRAQNVDPRADDRAWCRACGILGLDEHLHLFEIARRADHRPAGRHRKDSRAAVDRRIVAEHIRFPAGTRALRRPLR